jgi:hypothetical protein
MAGARMSLVAISIIAVLGLMASTAAWGARTDFELESLQGLNRIYVIVQKISPEIERDGLTVDMIKSKVSSKLEAAGIKTLPKSDSLSTKDGILVISLSSIKSKTGIHACSVDAELIQVTTLARNPDKPCPATTWASGIVAVVSPENVTKLTETVGEVVDDFVSDYQSANNTSGSGPEISGDKVL